MTKNKARIRKHYLFYFATFLMICSFISSAKPACELKKFENRYIQIKKDLALNSRNYWAIVYLADQAIALDSQINHCRNKVKRKVDTLTQFLNKLKKNGIIHSENIKPIQRIEKQTRNKVAILSEYQILSYRLNQTIEIIPQNGERVNPFNLSQKFSSVPALFHQLSLNNLVQHKRTIQQNVIEPLTKNQLLTLFALLVITFITGSYFIHKAKISSPILLSIRPVLKKYTPIILSFLVLNLYLWVLCHNITPTPNLRLGAFAILIYLFVLMALKIDSAISPEIKLWPKAKSQFYCIILLMMALYNWLLMILVNFEIAISVKALDLRVFTYIIVSIFLILVVITRNKKQSGERIFCKLLQRLWIIAHLFILFYLGTLVLSEQTLSNQLISLVDIFGIVFLNLSLLWLSWLIFETAYFDQYFSKSGIQLMKYLLLGVYTVIIMLTCAGYTHFGCLFAPNIICLVALLVISKKINQFVYRTTNDLTDPLTIKTHRYFAYRSKERVFILDFFRYIVVFSFLFFLFFAVLQIFGIIALVKTKHIFYELKNGASIYGLTVYPARVLRASFIFCILFLFARRFFYHPQKKYSLKDKNIAMMASSIIYFCAMIIIIIFSLFIAGINFTGLAIASGALSFGLGFGLRDTVRNFASGVYIIINKPIQVDDNVLIDGMEGTVKQIGLFSTRIKTREHSDFIVANSNITDNSITNYTFMKNQSYQLSIMIKLEDDMQIELSKQLLLDVTKNNPQIIQTPEPYVLFDSNYLALWCEIKHPMNKVQILSDLTYKIKCVFNQNKIAMQFREGD